MTAESIIEIPPGYHRWIRLGANWTLITSPYLLLYFILFLAIGGESSISGEIAQTLEIAGKQPVVFGATVLLDGLFHVVFFVTVVTLFAAFRLRWPVRASLLLVAGAWQMIMGFTKGLSSLYTFTSLGDAYVAGDAALRATLLAVAAGEFGLRSALQDMDTYGVMAILIIVSLIPADGAVPRAVRWLGWILTLAFLSPGPSFLVVVLLLPIWLFLIGRWLKRLLPAR